MDFYYITGIMFAGVLFVLFSFLVSRLISPRLPTADKDTPYECGEVPLGAAWTRFNVGYYIFALLFLIFDVEVAFLYPWAVVLKGLGVQALAAGGLFLGILFFGLAFAWRKGYLIWR